MKKTIISLISIALLGCLLAIGVTACSAKQPQMKPLYTVTYRSNDETADPYAVEQYAEGASFSAMTVEANTRQSGAFLAWYDGENRIAAGETYTMPAKDVTFYAQWENDVTALLDGVWSGCLQEDELVEAGQSLTAAIRRDAGSAYVILSSVSFDAADLHEEKENAVLRLEQCADGSYASDIASIKLSNNHLVMELDGKVAEFANWCPLSTAPQLSGVWNEKGGSREIEISDGAVYKAHTATTIGKVIGIGEYYLLVSDNAIETLSEGVARASAYSMILFTTAPDGSALVSDGGEFVFTKR